MKRHRLISSLSVVGLAGGIAAASGCTSSTATGKTGIGVDSLLFIKRQTTTVQNGTVNVDVAGGNGQVLDYQRYVPGGSLNILSPTRPDGTVTNLTSAFPQADFNGADVSFDASQAVFSMKRVDSDHYHIYTVALTGGHAIHQLTAGDYDDINPIYLPGGLVAFVTNEMYTAMGTRADEYEHSREALQLATISLDGGDADRHLFAQNLSHTVAPFLRYDGRIGFSQWEHFADVNDVKIRVADPDGTQVLAVAGQHGKPANSLFTVKEIAPNVMIGIGTARDRTIHAGALVQIDARNHADPVCLDDKQYASGGTLGHACIDEENVTYQVLTPDVPTGSDWSPVGRYREPSVLPDGRILVSWADGPVNDLNEQSLTPPDFGVYLYDIASGKNQLVYNDRSTWDLNAIGIAPRAEPPVIGSNAHTQDSTVAATIGSVDISQTSLNETVDGAEFSNVPLSQALHDGAVAVRVIEGFSSEISSQTVPISMFGLTMFEGAAVLGEAPVYNDGSWLVQVPPYVPLHMQPIDKYGLAIRSQQLWMQTMPGESRRCIGCHESRTGQGVPAFGQNPTVAEQQLPMQKPFTEAIADRTEFPWDVKVQPVLNASCTSCHNSSTTDYYTISQTDPVSGKTSMYKIPTLDLTDTPVTVYYDKSVHTWPASYVSIFYPAALEMGKVTVVAGTVPPKWGIPGSARASALTQKLNLRASDGSTAWPLSTNPLHPEDKQVQLTDEQRKTIAVYPMDLGGQYYARQNVGFMPVLAADPVNPSMAAP